MKGHKRITQQAGNEFIIEFDAQQTEPPHLRRGQKFTYENKKHKIIAYYPGMDIPGSYTYLVITETL